MPELPEVETIKRDIAPQVINKKIVKVIVRNYSLRWPIVKELPRQLTGSTIKKVVRRAKYLLVITDNGTLIIHFGMTGSLQVFSRNDCYKTHDHVIIIMGDNKSLRFNDPRKFGCVIWTKNDPYQHKLLAFLGPEPFAQNFTGEYLLHKSRNKRTSIKQFLMDGHIVAGIGNIYACEALFCARLHPLTAVGEITLHKYETLVACIKKVLQNALSNNGTTFRDFVFANGKRGSFKEQLAVYGRDGKPCVRCKTILQKILIAQRNTVFCPNCQNIY